MSEDRVDRALDRLETGIDDMVEELDTLIAVDTSFPPGSGYAAWCDVLETKLHPLGFETERVDVPENLWRAPDSEGKRVNLLARRVEPGDAVSIYFHSDTVPAGDGWTHDPYRLTRDGSRLYGRGAADMKGTVASVLAALRALAAENVELAYHPVLMFCTDEEGGLYPGIRYLAEQGRLEGHVMCLNGQAMKRIWAGCFGSLDVRLSFFGRTVHSGSPDRGVNAIEQALPALQALVALKKRVESRASNLPPPPDSHGVPLHARFTIAAASGGIKGSSIPARFDVVVNRRYTPDEDFETVIGEIRDTVDNAVQGTSLRDWSMETVGHLAPVTDPRGEKHWPRWIGALSEGFNWDPSEFRPWASGTSSDMGWVQRAGESEILLGGLGRPDRNVHGADEYTTTDDLLGLARAVLLYLARDFPGERPPQTPTNGRIS